MPLWCLGILVGRLNTLVYRLDTLTKRLCSALYHVVVCSIKTPLVNVNLLLTMFIVSMLIC